MSNDVLTLALTVHERKKDVAVRFNRVAHLSPELSWVTLTIDGEKRRLQLREDDEFAYVKTFLKGEHTMTLDFGGVWPAGLVTLPEETTALTEILPVIADCATLEPLAAGSLTTPETPLTNLTTIYASFFAHNAQLKDLTGFFAGTNSLTTVPESLFFPLIYAENFTRVFAGAGLTEVPEQLFHGKPRAEDLTESFRG